MPVLPRVTFETVIRLQRKSRKLRLIDTRSFAMRFFKNLPDSMPQNQKSEKLRPFQR